MTRPPCVRLCPAYPDNPRTRIEGESPPLRKGTYGLRSRALARRLEGWPQAPSLWPSFEARPRGRAPQDDGGVCGQQARHPLMRQNLCQEFLRALAAGAAEKLLLWRVLDDLALVHEDHAMRDLSGKAHLVR